MNKTGIVMKIENKSAFLMTSAGEFVKVKVSGKAPKLGETYSSSIVKAGNAFKHMIAAASLLFIFLTGGTAYAYYTPVNSVVIDINPSIELKTNRFDRIIKVTPLNEDAKVIVDSVNLKNKSLNDGLNLIIDESKEHNFINESYVDSGKFINVNINSKQQKAVDLSKFEQHVKDSNLNVKIKDKDKVIKLENGNEKEKLNNGNGSGKGNGNGNDKSNNKKDDKTTPSEGGKDKGKDKKDDKTSSSGNTAGSSNLPSQNTKSGNSKEKDKLPETKKAKP